MSSESSATQTEHEAGCAYGGFSCGYWLRVEGCPEYHPETHIVRDDRCLCGHEFPGFGTGLAVSDAEDKELPLELRQGLGTPIELEFPDVVATGNVPGTPAPVAVEQSHHAGVRTFLVHDEMLAENLDWSEPVQFRFEPDGDHYMLVMRRVKIG